MIRYINVICREPRSKAQVIQIPNTMESLSEIVGGYVEFVPISSDLMIACNEEGKLIGLPYNITLCYQDFVGPIVVLDRNPYADGGFRGFTRKEAERIAAKGLR